MFGYITANPEELTEAQRSRYTGVYCGICREIGTRSSQLSRLGLRYDMAFLALLLMSLYEPREEQRVFRCPVHPMKKRSFVSCEILSYTADMNVALAYCKSLDDWQDEKKLTARWFSSCLEPHYRRICEAYPRQCGVIRESLAQLAVLEEEGCPSPDRPAAVFGKLMAELFVWKQDRWETDLRGMGDALGRFVYFVDAVLDRQEDRKTGNYNPFLLGPWQPPELEKILLLTMGRATAYYEKLPLVQDKELLDQILYSGVWIRYREKNRKEGKPNDR